MGGTNKFVTKQPELDNYTGVFQSDLSGTVHGGLKFSEAAAVIVPTEPGAAASRTCLSYTVDSGYIDLYARIEGQPGPLVQSGVNQEAALKLRTTGKLQLGDD